jgi:hypothetical protein
MKNYMKNSMKFRETEVDAIPYSMENFMKIH